LNCNDIEGAKPQVCKFKSNRKPTNPLCPEYKLSKVKIRLATPPRFIRDSIGIDDIQGSKPRPIIRKKCLRNTMDISDIEGAKGSTRMSGVKVKMD